MTDPSDTGPGVDRDALAGLEQDVGAEVVLSLIEMFCDSGPQRVALLRDHARDADAAAAAEVLHSLKSSAGTLGALQLSQVVERAERAARTGQVVEFVALIEPINAATERAIELLRDYRKQLE